MIRRMTRISPTSPPTSGQRIISTLVADTSSKYSENQNDDED